MLIFNFSGQKPQFNCRHCSQTFDVRSDMEAHCIFIHNQVLQECKENGCDFCTTDPNVLETHKKENHDSCKCLLQKLVYSIFCKMS